MYLYQTTYRLRESIRSFFGAPKPALQVAGLIWRQSEETNGELEVLLITSRGTGRWILPKGWPEDGETLAQSAMRETREEAGIIGESRDEDIGSYFYDKILRDGSAKRCEVKVFSAQYVKEAKKWPEKNERERWWVSPKIAAQHVNEPDLSELLKNFKPDKQKRAA